MVINLNEDLIDQMNEDIPYEVKLLVPWIDNTTWLIYWYLLHNEDYICDDHICKQLKITKKVLKKYSEPLAIRGLIMHRLLVYEGIGIMDSIALDHTSTYVTHIGKRYIHALFDIISPKYWSNSD
jgi:hypothetical protein